MALPQRTKIFLVIFYSDSAGRYRVFGGFWPGAAAKRKPRRDILFLAAGAGWQGGGNRQWPIFIKRAATVHQRNGKSGF